MNLGKIQQLDALIEPMFRAARIPGGALAIVANGKRIFAQGYGYRDLNSKLPMTAETAYPIASTTKAINTTLLGMLVDEGKVAWDMPVQNYLPRFRLGDSQTSTQVTLRDLVTMRTGLPRHDWFWTENAISRKELVERLCHLELSAGLRERFQYNNLTSTTAGHVAEIVTGQPWEGLVKTRIFEPLGMSHTSTALPAIDNVTVSYHENSRRELVATRRLATEVTAPSGGAVYSTVEDMAQWMLFNLSGGRVNKRSLIQPRTLAELHSAQVVIGADPSAPSPNAAYGLGWFVDFYNGFDRVSHGGYLHDVNSEVMLFPSQGLGIVAFSNFGPPSIARQIIQHAFDLLMELNPVRPFEETLAEYEMKIVDTRLRNASVRRVDGTSLSHRLDEYAGSYAHPAYGRIDIRKVGSSLVLLRNNLEFLLEHWHYDVWVIAENDLFPIQKPHAFDRASRIPFETGVDGHITAFSLQLEPAVSPIRFARH